MSEPTTILICTVGGSHQPIVQAIKDLRPAQIIFVCSEDNPATGAKGSYIQIEGKGKCIKARWDDPSPALPNIPQQAGYTGAIDILRVPADDLNTCFERINENIGVLLASSSSITLIADYTGGTKTMTAALAMAAIAHDRVRLHLVTGRRSDLVRVRDGSESGVWTSVEGIRLSRKISESLCYWQHYSYAQASEALQQIAMPEQAIMRGRLQRARDLSDAFAAWHRFDHHKAHALLEEYQSVLGKAGRYIGMVSSLANTRAPRHQPAMIYDLWLNAERRGQQGNHDEAVAVCYRLWERTAQWLLQSQCEIATSDIHPDQIPPSMQLACNGDGKYQVGLFAAWEMLHILLPDSPAGRFFARERKRFLNVVTIRNHSILAHGFAPVSDNEWNTIAHWTRDVFLSMLKQEFDRVKFGALPIQLPDRFPELSLV